jgi:hypothetical protein
VTDRLAEKSGRKRGQTLFRPEKGAGEGDRPLLWALVRELGTGLFGKPLLISGPQNWDRPARRTRLSRRLAEKWREHRSPSQSEKAKKGTDPSSRHS